MKHNLTGRATSFFVTAPLPCPYLDGRTERRLVVELEEHDSSSMHDTLSRIGFRRSHRLVYTPVCQGCQACLAVRTIADQFDPTASQRRVWRSNEDLQACEAPPRATAEQYELFAAYQAVRHHGGDMATMDFYDYQALVEETPVQSRLVEFRLPSGELAGCCLVDHMRDGLSAVYSFFDPSLAKRSLGTYTILWLIDRAGRIGLPFVYLGYWIDGSPKMSYKEKFQPLEYFADGNWTLLGD